jgi:hypothetical protein
MVFGLALRIGVQGCCDLEIAAVFISILMGVEMFKILLS